MAIFHNEVLRSLYRGIYCNNSVHFYRVVPLKPLFSKFWYFATNSPGSFWHDKTVESLNRVR